MKNAKSGWMRRGSAWAAGACLAFWAWAGTSAGAAEAEGGATEKWSGSAESVSKTREWTAPVNPLFVEWVRARNGGDETKGFQSKGEEGAAQAPHALGYVPPMVDYRYLREIPRSPRMGFAAESPLPRKFDLRSRWRLSPVRDQGNYGTCWAHGTLGSLESALAMQGRGRFDFSEKHLANTHGLDSGFAEGGNGDIALAYLTRWSGPIAEEQDPYPDDKPFQIWKKNGEKGRIVVPASPRGTPLGHLQNATKLSPMQTSLDTEEIQRTVMARGGVYAGYIHVWGALTADQHSHYWDGDLLTFLVAGGGGHVVLIVGWDDDYPRENFRQPPPADGAFLAKNSWGEDFGDNGYFWVSYCDATFGAMELYAFHELEPADNYKSVYYHDPLGVVDHWGKSTTAWGANEFVAREDERVAAAGFYALVPETGYEITVYTGCSASDPTSGRRWGTTKGTTDHCGYATVKLDREVPVRKGERFSVVFKLDTAPYRKPLAFEAYFPKYYDEDAEEWIWTSASRATANRGESFVSADGQNWKDFTELFDNGNLCLKAYTVAADNGRFFAGAPSGAAPEAPEAPEEGPAAPAGPDGASSGDVPSGVREGGIWPAEAYK